MTIQSTAASRVIGDRAGACALLRTDAPSADEVVQLDADDPAAGGAAMERLPLVASLLASAAEAEREYDVFIDVRHSPEGFQAVRDLLDGLSRAAMAAPTDEKDPARVAQHPVSIVPTAGGMALGLAGGVGLGMVIDVLRSTSDAAGHPMLSNLAVGLGLLGTAIGGASGATGTLPHIKIDDMFELSFRERVANALGT